MGAQEHSDSSQRPAERFDGIGDFVSFGEQGLAPMAGFARPEADGEFEGFDGDGFGEW